METSMLQATRSPRLARFGAIADLFAWPLTTSHYLELVNPLWATHVRKARVEGVLDETDDARTLVLRPGRGWRRHRPGQHIRVGVSVSGTQYVRTYSISSAPERLDADECITITVKAAAGGRASSHLVRNVLPGAYLSLGLPQGDFVLPESTPVRPLFVTAGSGVTPVMSMLRSFAARGDLPDIVHVHYARHAREVIFGSELTRLAEKNPRYRLKLVCTREQSGTDSRHFSSKVLDELCPEWQVRECYGCGPQSLLADLEACWSRAGATPRLHLERFRAPLAERPPGAAGGQVRFERGRIEVEADGHTPLLRIAEDAGLNPPHGCRMGICHSCTATMVSGCVRDLRNNDLIDEPGTRIQICVCAANGNVELEL